MTDAADAARFAGFVATLGRGPGRSRALTREEAREAFDMVLAGRADALQVGAFLMLLRYRGEDADEITGLVEAAREAACLGASPLAELDWPSYGAGRTRTAPWFLLAALALARSGIRVLMHGSNEFSDGQSVEAALHRLGIDPARDMDRAARQLRETRFAYLPLRRLSPALDRLLGLRTLFGLRSPVNTVARLLDPGSAPAGVDGVFHPAYLDVHMGVAERLHRPRLAVLKGGGGEAERTPAKPVAVHLWQEGIGRSVVELPACDPAPTASVTTPPIEAVWRGDAGGAPAATARATIALALIATGQAAPAQADAEAAAIWSARL